MRIYGLFYITTIIPMHETDNETDLSLYFSVLTTFNSFNMEEGIFEAVQHIFNTTNVLSYCRIQKAKCHVLIP